MTPAAAAAEAERLTGQVYDRAVLLRWLSELDGILALDLYRVEPPEPYTTEDQAERALLIPFPWDGGVYVHHLEAMTYFSNGEYDRYANARQLSEHALAEFRRYTRRNAAYPAPQGKG